MYHSIQDFMFKKNILVGQQINRPDCEDNNYDIHVWTNHREAMCGAWNYHLTPVNFCCICPTCHEKIWAMYLMSFLDKHQAVIQLTREIHKIMDKSGYFTQPFMHFKTGDTRVNADKWIANALDMDIVSVTMPWL